MKLYITRHGETEWNTEKRMQGFKNSNLTEKGVSNAKKLGSALKDINFSKIYSSPLGRTIDTSKHILGDRDIEIITVDYLKEMNLGTWGGMLSDDIIAKYPKEYDNFWNNPQEYTPIDGENFYEVMERVSKGLEEIINNEDGDILIVTHTVVIKCLLAKLKNLPIKNLWDPPYIYDTCLTILEVENGEIKFLKEADICHLD